MEDANTIKPSKVEISEKFFSAELKSSVENYVSKHLENLNSIETRYFSFIDEASLKTRLSEEFYCARYIYKILQGLQAEKHVQRSQVRIQILQYASIYEACIHHLLFENLKDHKAVQNLSKKISYKNANLPLNIVQRIEKWKKPSDPPVACMYKKESTEDISKIRFDKKAIAAQKIGLISKKTMDTLIELYSARNGIHIHAEIAKSLSYELSLSKKAFSISKAMRGEIIHFINKKGSAKYFPKLTLPLPLR